MCYDMDLDIIQNLKSKNESLTYEGDIDVTLQPNNLSVNNITK